MHNTNELNDIENSSRDLASTASRFHKNARNLEM